jgi:hypothetical protein
MISVNENDNNFADLFDCEILVAGYEKDLKLVVITFVGMLGILLWRGVPCD